jgi:hypothetical protein
MNFKEQQNALIGFLSNNYRNYLPAHIAAPEITTDFLDFDKYKGDFTLFVDFARIDFRQSSYKDDCGDIEHLSLAVYLAHRNNQQAILNDNNLDSAYAFYELIRGNPGLGIAQNSTIEGIDFYRYVEGTKYLVVSEITLSLDVEI